MKTELFEQLVRDHPDIFQKSGDFEFSIGDGWYSIVNTLLGLMSHNVESARRRLNYAQTKGEDTSKEEKLLEEALFNLPTIAQVKEKYGGLRFYIDNGSADVHAYIEFAECISNHTCEVCGSPGEPRNDGWVKVLCDSHHREREQKSEPGFYPSRKTPAHLPDE